MDINSEDIEKDVIIAKMKEYKEKGNRKIEEKIVKEHLKNGLIEYFDEETQEWKDTDISNVLEIVKRLKSQVKEPKVKKAKGLQHPELAVVEKSM